MTQVGWNGVHVTQREYDYVGTVGGQFLESVREILAGRIRPRVGANFPCDRQTGLHGISHYGR